MAFEKLQIEIKHGSCTPLGASKINGAYNFAVFSKNARRIEICIFENDIEIKRIALPYKTGDIFHGEIHNIEITKYGIRAYGEFNPQNGDYFNPNKLLIDPYALLIDGEIKLHDAMFSGENIDDEKYKIDSSPFVPKSIINSPKLANPKIKIPLKNTIIYELHLKGFSQNNPQIPIEKRGTFKGLCDKASIEYLKQLGINCVEILPIAAWIDELHLKKLGLTNYWGYNPITMMAPHPKYAPNGWDDVRECVEALEENGIETIIDVVFNHSGEGDEKGPSISYRGFDNKEYYKTHNGIYSNEAGCGNVFDCTKPIVIKLFMDSLRAWRKFGGVHGFRFDLASILGRGTQGFETYSKLLMAISQDEILRDLKLIAEPWDCAGYNLGQFPLEFAEWNDKFRDIIKGFWKNDAISLGQLAHKLGGSQNIFFGKTPSKSINYITAHDGFSLMDLVSYSHKHNLKNGENNNDGTNNNISWNNGIEGATGDKNIIKNRKKDIKCLLSMLLMARGTPMISMGSESGKSQNGNNNAYAQDNDISYFDWQNFDDEIFEFCAQLIKIRKDFMAGCDDSFLSNNPNPIWPDVIWRNPNGTMLNPHDWDDNKGEALLVNFNNEQSRIILAINRGPENIEFKLPPPDDEYEWVIKADCENQKKHGESIENNIEICAKNIVILSQEKAKQAKFTPISNERLNKICDALGIANIWHDVGGNETIVKPQSKLAIIEAMGFDCKSEFSAKKTLNEIAKKHDFRQIPFHKSFRVGDKIEIPICGENGISNSIILENENGEQSHFSSQNLIQKNAIAINDAEFKQLILEIDGLEIGKYRLFFENEPEEFCSITIAPKSFYFPNEFENRKFFGLSAQIYSVTRENDQGFGDFTSLEKLLKFTRDNGGAMLAINPLHALFQNSRDFKSPYYPSDRRFLEPLYIDAGQAIKHKENTIDYDKVWREKRAILWQDFLKNKLDKDFIAFANSQGQRLEEYALFEALSAHFNGQNWQNWPSEYKDKNPEILNDFKLKNKDEIEFQKYLQFLCDAQLNKATKNKMIIGLGRDLAIGSAPNGAEAWANYNIMAKNVSIGAPPDPLGPNGQIWGLPPYNPLSLVENHFSQYCEIFAANMKYAGALRIDHAMGLMRQFWVPNNMDGKDGTYVAFPFNDLMNELKLLSHKFKCIIIAEDLGTLPHGFSETMNNAKGLSYRVLPFERHGNGFKSPQDYPFLSFACASTHDLPPIKGWWKSLDIFERLELKLISDDDFKNAISAREIEKFEILNALFENGLIKEKYSNLPPECNDEIINAIHAYIAKSNAFLAIAQFEDIAKIETSINLPGTDKERPNWQNKVTPYLEEIIQSFAKNNKNALIIDAISKNRTKIA